MGCCNHHHHSMLYIPLTTWRSGVRWVARHGGGPQRAAADVQGRRRRVVHAHRRRGSGRVPRRVLRLPHHAASGQLDDTRDVMRHTTRRDEARRDVMRVSRHDCRAVCCLRVREHAASGQLERESRERERASELDCRKGCIDIKIEDKYQPQRSYANTPTTT